MHLFLFVVNIHCDGTGRPSRVVAIAAPYSGRPTIRFQPGNIFAEVLGCVFPNLPVT
jgi:hypothetical protein